MTVWSPSPSADLARGAIAGAVVLVLLFVFFWATAAAESLPATAPAFIRAYTPEHGVKSLVSGLFWTGLLGAAFGAGLFGLYGLARRFGRHGRP